MVINEHSSSRSYVTSGVPQGSVLGPLLFICYINDLPKEVKSTLKLYANDVLLYRIIRSIDDCEMLQKDLDIVNKWADSWQMAFNLGKCYLVRVTNKKRSLKHCYRLQGEEIKSVSHAKYLSAVIDEHLSFNEHIKLITNKANSVNCIFAKEHWFMY